MAARFKINQRVILKANKKEGWLEEQGIYLGSSGRGMCMVKLLDHTASDDGLREISVSGIKAASARKLLSEFPLVLEAFKVILDDQPYPPHCGVFIDGTVPVPKKWHAQFVIAEEALSELSGRSLRQIGVTATDLKRENLTGDVKLSESAMEHFILPINDMCTCIMEHMKDYKAAVAAGDVLYAFFDGDLRTVFQKGQYGKRYANRRGT